MGEWKTGDHFEVGPGRKYNTPQGDDLTCPEEMGMIREYVKEIYLSAQSSLSELECRVPRMVENHRASGASGPPKILAGVDDFKFPCLSPWQERAKQPGGKFWIFWMAWGWLLNLGRRDMN